MCGAGLQITDQGLDVKDALELRRQQTKGRR